MRMHGLILMLPFVVAACGSNIANVQPPIVVTTPKPPGPLDRYHFPAVYFEPGLSKMSTQQKTSLDAMGSAFRQAGVMQICLTGHTDGREGGRAAQRLSTRRAEAVAMELIQIGYGREDIVITGVGATKPRIADPEKRELRLERFVLIQGQD